MKQLITFLFLIGSIFTMFSQENETTNVPKNYLGEINDRHVFCTGLSHVRTNKVVLYEVADSNILATETIQLQNDRFEQLFIFQNSLYAVVSDREENMYSLIHFNELLVEQERIEIMDYGDHPQNMDQKVMSQGFERKTRFIYHSGKLIFHVSFNNVRLAVIDFSSMQSKTYNFDVPLATSFEPADALFFNETDAHVAFEYWGQSLQTKCYYGTFINGKSNAFKLNDYTENKPSGANASSFKFLTYQDKNYLVSACYKSGFDRKQIGFTLTEIPSQEITALKLAVLVNDKLDNPALWSKKNYKKWRKNAPGNLYRNAKLDELFIYNDQLITVLRFDPEGQNLSNILITSINLGHANSPSINWNTMTHNGVNNGSYYWFNQYANAYITVIKNDRLYLLYNCNASSFNSDGTIKRSSKEANPSGAFKTVQTKIAMLDININDGSVEFINYTHRDDSNYPAKITTPYYYVNNNKLYFILERIQPSTNSQPTLFTPKVAIIPL